MRIKNGLFRHQPNVHELRQFAGSGDEFDYLIISDIHYDADDCHRELLKKHLNKIQQLNGKVLIIGDLFDVMGCYKDPRSKAANVRPEYIRKDRSYLDLVIEDAVSFFEPYKDNIALIGFGNHETAIIKHRDTDPLQRFAQLLQIESALGGYAGYFKFQYFYSSNKTMGASLKMAYHHGHGGTKRSKGILNAQIDGFIYSDADIIVSGHDHNKLHDPSNVRYRLSSGNKIVFNRQHWLKTGSYVRNDNAPLVAGWHVEKGFLPRAMGGWFMKHTLKKNRERFSCELSFEEAF